MWLHLADELSIFVQVMAWCPLGNNPLSEPMSAQIRVAMYGIIRHWVIFFIFQVEVTQAFAKFSLFIRIAINQMVRKMHFGSYKIW